MRPVRAPIAQPRRSARTAAAEGRRIDPIAWTSPRRISTARTHVVSFLKLLLPAVAVALVALILLWPQLNPMAQGFRLRPVTVGFEDLENLRVVSPRYVGSDSKNQPYTITAEQATQVSGNSDVTDLVMPKGDIMLNGGTWVALSAQTGTYRKEQRILDLEGDVNLFHDGGYEIVTSRAKIDLANGSAAGDDPVVGQGPDVEMQGQGFRVYDRGNRIVVTGQSKLVIHQATTER
ncbi:MAG TPA: LPS export ABC transporter periplasmic protein LptC [Alphaproteobacteria bacterium]